MEQTAQQSGVSLPQSGTSPGDRRVRRGEKEGRRLPPSSQLLLQRQWYTLQRQSVAAGDLSAATAAAEARDGEGEGEGGVLFTLWGLALARR